jgi:ribose transport system substrate-binding protein
VRQAQEQYLIGYVEGLGEIEFSARMRTGMEEVAEEMGVELLICDSKYEAEAAINCAQLMADRGVDGVVNSNWYAPAAEAMSEILTEAGIPHVASDVEHPNAVFFGVDNCDTGHMSGNWLADYALNVWNAPPEGIWVVMGENPDVGEEPEKRISCSEDTIRETIPGIPDDHFVRILNGSFTEQMFEGMTTWLTAHPDAKYILTATINDQGGVGAAAACEAAGRVENCAVVGQDGIQMAYAEFEKPEDESAFKASIGHFPELYGKQMLPMVVDMIEGNPVPDYVRTFIDVIDRSNLDVYPLGGVPEVAEEVEAGAYVPEIRPADQRWKIGYGNGMASLDFSARVTQSIYDTAELMGVDVVECDNNYDQEATFNCADLLITQEVDGIVFANWLAPIAETVGQKWVDAGIPAVTYDGPHPGAVDFGADNYTAGFKAGEYLGQYVKDQGWDVEDVWLVRAENPDVGEGPGQRLVGCEDGVRSVIDLRDDQVAQILNGSFTDQAYEGMTTWLTGHPDAKHVLACSINDQGATGLSGALEAADRTETSAVVGQGVDAPALAELHGRTEEESAFKGSVAYFPDKYGEWMVPIIVDLIEGNSVPPVVRINHLVIDRSDVGDYYPEE